MSTKAELFFQEMNSKKIAFIGMGVTNLNIIKLFYPNSWMLLSVIGKQKKNWEKTMMNCWRWAPNLCWGKII